MRNIDVVAINSFGFNSIIWVIIQIETSSRQKRTVEYKTHRCSDGNLLLRSMFKNIFPRATIKQLVKYKDKHHLWTYTKTSIPQLGVSRITFTYNDKQKVNRFFIVPGNCPALLRMPYNEIIDNLM